MIQKNLKFFLFLILSVVIALGLSLSLQSLLAAWASPTAVPPDANVSPPINEGPNTQVKTGILGVTNDFYVGTDTLYVDNTNKRVGIGTNGPGYKLDIKLNGTDTGDVISLSNTVWGNAGTIGIDSGGTGIYILGGGYDDSYKFTVKSGNVGIGTTSPSGRLHVVTTAWSNHPIIQSASDGIQASLQFGHNGIEAAKSFILGTWDDNTFRINVGNDLDSSNTMTIDRSGNVGIGTTGPNNPLVVKKDGSNFQRIASFYDTTTDGYPYINVGYSDTADGITLGHTNRNPLGANYGWISYGGLNPTTGQGIILKSDGNVGIGTTEPSTGLKLDVEGKVGATEYCDQNGANCKTITSMGTVEPEVKSDECSLGGGCTATATCSSGKKIIYGMSNSASTRDNLLGTYCDNNPQVCDAYCAVGATSCSRSSPADSGYISEASVYVVCI